jgi:hypothetical protein
MGTFGAEVLSSGCSVLIWVLSLSSRRKKDGLWPSFLQGTPPFIKPLSPEKKGL